MSAPSPDPRFASPADLSQNAGHGAGEQPLPPPLPAAGRGVPRDAAVSVGNADSHGGGIAIGPGASLTDNRKYEYHLPAAAPSGPAFVVPYPHNPLFTGREAELARIGALLAGGACVAVVGTGGLGKTQLAAEYALGARARYPGGVFWLNMEQAEGIAGQVADLAGPRGLNLPAAPALDFQGKRDAVRAAWEEPVARLLIFDNLEDPAVWREWRPRGGGARVLITSRRQTWAATSGVEALPLQPLGRPASQELLLAPRAKSKKTTAAALLADPATAADADAICEALGDLPLALALAGAYLETTPSATLARYRADIEAAPLARLETTLDDPLPTGHEASILKTFALSYDKLDANKSDDTRARTILHRAALLAPAPIPRRLLVRAAGLDPDDAYLQEQADRALRRLAALGLIEDLGEEGVRLHRLLAAYARHRAAAPAKDSAAVEKALIDEVYDVGTAGYPLVGLPYLPHLQQAATEADARGAESAATLLNNVGVLLKTQGDLMAAQSYVERALTICEQTLGPTHPNTVSGLNNMGLLLKAQGDIAGARPYYERALAIRKATLGLTHPDTAQSLNNLGSLLQDLGDFADALPYFQQALAIYEKVFGSDHPDTATVLNNLGSLLQDLGDFARARPYYERALEIRERKLGHNHPDTAATFSNLGSLLEDLGNHTGAQPYYEQALAIDRAAYGEDHLEVVNDLNKLGNLMQKLGDLVRARSYYERALEIREQKLGSTHLDTARSLIELGTVVYKQGDLPSALTLLNRALDIWEQKLGSDHPYTRATQSSLKIVRRALAEPGGGEG